MSSPQAGDLLPAAVFHYHNGNFQSATKEFRILINNEWKQSKRPSQERQVMLSNDNHDVAATTLMLEADAAICQARASGLQIDYQNALDKNRRYYEVLKISPGAGPISQLLRATVSAVWLYLRMGRPEMARHSGWECLQGVTGRITGLGDYIWIEKEAMSILEMKLSPNEQASLRQLKHALSVLNLQSTSPESCLQVSGDDAESCGSQEHLLHALSLARDPHGREERDLYLERAVSYSDVQDQNARRVQALVQAIDVMSCGRELAVSQLSLLDCVARRSCPYEMNLLGCMLARHGDLERALEIFDSCRQIAGDDADFLNEIVSNMAECLLLMGEPGRAKLMLLHLIQNLDGKTREDLNASGSRLLLSHPSSQLRADELLWRAFLSATLESSLAVALSIAEELCNQSGSRCHVTLLCYVFALLQAQRPTLALEACPRFDLEDSAVLSLVFRLFEAEALLSSPTTKRGDVDASDADRSANLLAKLTSSSLYAKDDCLVASFENNLGVLHLLKGHDDDAVVHFRRATWTISTTDLPNVRPHFNLCLLLWKMGSIQEAVSVWGSVRSFNVGDGQLTALKNAAQKFNSTKRSASLLDGIPGMDFDELLLMDCLVLQALAVNREDLATKICVDELLSQCSD